MSTLVTIQGTDLITDSRADINNNFSALNTDKMETSVLDTDTTLAANSDAKVATQKAVKAYVDALTLLSLEVVSSTSSTFTITTTASQKVIVWVKGNIRMNAGPTTDSIVLKYDGVTKDSVTVGTDATSSTVYQAFALQYTETPGAGTKDITVTTTNYTPENLSIIVLKI